MIFGIASREHGVLDLSVVTQSKNSVELGLDNLAIRGTALLVQVPFESSSYYRR